MCFANHHIIQHHFVQHYLSLLRHPNFFVFFLQLVNNIKATYPVGRYKRGLRIEPFFWWFQDCPVVYGRQNFFQILPAGWSGNLVRLTTIWHNCYQDTFLFCKYLFKVGKITQPNCIYDDASIHNMRNTFSFIVRDGDWKEVTLRSRSAPVLSRTSAM